jgi:hypothetical protein
MKKIPLFLCFILLSVFANAQTTNLILDFPYQGNLSFLDSIEDKLLNHLQKICSNKIKDDIELYRVSYLHLNRDHWMSPLPRKGICIDTSIKEHIKSNQYTLDIKWDNNLDTGYVVGFSREYYIRRAADEAYLAYDMLNGEMCMPQDIPKLSKFYFSPLYQLPLKEYNRFLSKREMKSLDTVIKYTFINKVNDVGYYAYGMNGVTERVVDLDIADSLAQMPWKHWTWRMKGMLKNSMNKVYKDVSCSQRLSRQKVDSDISVVQKIYDSLGHSTNAGSFEIDFKSIIIAEKWNFDTTNTKLCYPYPAFMISRKILAIGFIPDIPKGFEDYGYYPLWVKYQDLEKFCKEEGQQLDMYNILINSALFRKVGLFY